MLSKKKNKANSNLFTTIKKDFKANKSLYLIVLLPLIYYLIFHYIPMYGIVIAFKQYIPAFGIAESPWVGFKHFADFFNNIYFWRLIKNTFTISFTGIVFGFPAPILLALLINELTHKKFVRVVQTVTYLPHFISLVVICGMITTFLGTNGFISNIVTYFTGDNTSLLMKPEYFTAIYVISDIWQGIGWGSIIYFAALTNIDQSLYEACEIDGGGKLRQAIHITLPGILPTIVIMFILRMGSILNVGFEKIILLYNEVTLEQADVIASYVYRKGLGEGNYSYATAVGLFNSLVNIVFLVVTNKVCKKFTDTSLW